MLRLQVLICTIGREGIERISHTHYPQVEGVGYLVSWQQPDEHIDTPSTLLRDDMQVCITPTRGICRNRNHAISCATASLCLMTDDDVTYTAEELSGLIRTFDANPEVELMTVQYSTSGAYRKAYPEYSFDLRHRPRGYYVSAIEIAFRREAVVGRVAFCENISLGTPVLRCGEEDVFIKDVLDAGIVSRYYPIVVGTHAHASTAARDGGEPYFLMTKGAVFSYVHRRTWFLRLLVNAWRSRKQGIPFFRFMRYTLSGVRYARRHHVFSHKSGR